MQNNFYQPPNVPQNRNYVSGPQYQQAFTPATIPPDYFRQIRKNQKKELVKTGLIIGATLLSMLVIQFIEAIVLQLTGIYSSAAFQTATAQNLFNAVGGHILSIFLPFLIMALLSKKRFVTPVVPRKKIAPSKAVAWICFGMGCCIAADYLVALLSTIASNNGYKLTQNTLPSANSVVSCIAEILSTILLPAIIEEFAFRCCSLGVLRKYGKAFGVVVVSIIFGAIHANIIQFIFATCVGLILGYITVKTDNVIIAMIVHGLNNALSVIGDITDYISGSNTLGDKISTAIMLIWPVLGVFGMIYLITRDGLFKSKYSMYPKEVRKQIKKSEKAAISANPYVLPLASKILCILPGFLLFAPYFIYSIISTIIKQ